jgi:hypothetical protein
MAEALIVVSVLNQVPSSLKLADLSSHAPFYFFHGWKHCVESGLNIGRDCGFFALRKTGGKKAKSEHRDQQ